ncbi:MAG: DNA repair protein RecO [bacterium]
MQKTEAIILKSINHGETSKILTAYTRARGKISLMAKGVRNIRSRIGGAVEPLNYISMLFYEKESREIQLLSQAELLVAFPHIKASLPKTSLALAVCELVNQLEFGQEPNPLLFRLLLGALKGIDGSAGDGKNVFRAFQIHLFDIMGFRPHFHGCIGCQKSLAGTVRFDLQQGGLACETCRREHAPSVMLHHDALTGLQALQKVHLSQLNGLLESPASQNQVDMFLHAYLRSHVEGVKELKALQFLRKI